jgi:hypothetical protein
MGRLQEIFKCALVVHADEYRISRNPTFNRADNPDFAVYQVCVDCGRAGRVVGGGLAEGFDRMSKIELQEREKYGFEVDDIRTIKLTGIKRHHLKKYPRGLVEVNVTPLSQYLNPF